MEYIAWQSTNELQLLSVIWIIPKVVPHHHSGALSCDGVAVTCPAVVIVNMIIRCYRLNARPCFCLFFVFFFEGGGGGGGGNQYVQLWQSIMATHDTIMDIHKDNSNLNIKTLLWISIIQSWISIMIGFIRTFHITIIITVIITVIINVIIIIIIIIIISL